MNDYKRGQALAETTIARARALSDPGLADMLGGAAAALLDESITRDTDARTRVVLHTAALVMVVAERLTVRRG